MLLNNNNQPNTLILGGLTSKNNDMTPSQKLSIEKMFIEAVQAYLFPIFESEKAAYKMVADELKKVLEVFGYSELQIKQLIDEAKK